MLIVVGGIKGGTGKTTIATNLAVILATNSRKTLLIDADEQRSSSDWAEQREDYFSDALIERKAFFPTVSLVGKNIYQQARKLCADFQEIVVDVGGRDTTTQRSILTIANIFVIPFKPRSLDIWTMGSVRNLINEIKSINPNLKCYVVINQADTRGVDNEEALKILAELESVKCLSGCLRNRKSFSNAAAMGLGVIELAPGDDKATKEIYEIYKAIYE